MGELRDSDQRAEPARPAGLTTSSPPLTDDATAGLTAGEGALTPHEIDVVQFAALRWRSRGVMEAQVWAPFGWTLTRYHQVLDALTDRPEAAAHAPQLIAGSARLRATRRRNRSGPTSPEV